ncbi:hypothetical protein [Leadbetterella sp. DM7]|uniref:hypothetical protein n=1 Tax=Leadbetterella sp. DM7 TaxID=3235085 RepID=UPI00349EE68C
MVQANWRKVIEKFKVVRSAGRSILQEIDNYAALATKQGSKSKVMLGKYNGGAATSSINRAGADHCYSDMGDNKWNEAMALVGNNLDECGRLTKSFEMIKRY